MLSIGTTEHEGGSLPPTLYRMTTQKQTKNKHIIGATPFAFSHKYPLWKLIN